MHSKSFASCAATCTQDRNRAFEHSAIKYRQEWFHQTTVVSSFKVLCQCWNAFFRVKTSSLKHVAVLCQRSEKCNCLNQNQTEHVVPLAGLGHCVGVESFLPNHRRCCTNQSRGRSGAVDWFLSWKFTHQNPQLLFHAHRFVSTASDSDWCKFCNFTSSWRQSWAGLKFNHDFYC